MWFIDSFSTVKEKALGPEGEEIILTKLSVGSVLFANHIEATSWEKNKFQTNICSCMVEGCNSGSWLSLRRSGDFVLFIPAFDLMLDSAEFYGPPGYVKQNGIPILTLQNYRTHLVPLVPEIPDVNSINTLTHGELIRILQFEAPLKFLGVFPDEPAVRQTDDIVACSSGEYEDWIVKLNQLLQRTPKDSPVSLRVRAVQDEIFEFYTDNPVHRVWQPLIVVDNDVRFYLHPEITN